MPDGKTVKVPFLNGGLFDKEEFDEHVLTFPSKLFHNPDFEDAILTEKSKGNARGFLDFLDAFNFTVYEDSPDDHTVAVDPEMLGHIFENLLEDNKDKGAFYTPKEIVHYMCQESLTEYLCTTLQIKDKVAEREAVNHLLKNKVVDEVLKPEITELEKALDKVKICDPAIGSGAFPMGLLQEIFSIKELIAYETGKEWKPAETKLNIIQNSIYGVDIEKGAVDIARLRFWLSLVVDEEKPKPLPNLDYKIVVGDSLISKFDGEIVEIDWERKSSVGKADEYVKNMQRLLVKVADKQKKYFNPNNQNKKKLQAEIRNLKIELLINQLSFNKELYLSKNVTQDSFMPTSADIKLNTERGLKIAGFDKLIAKLKNLLENPDEPFNHFDWKLDFPEVLNPYLVPDEKQRGFDIVIGNPPYVVPKNLKDNEKQFFENKYISALYQINLYLLFIDQSILLSKVKGVVTLIVPNTWLINKTVSIFRKYLLENFNIQKIVDLTKVEVFDATVLPVIFNIGNEKIENGQIDILEYFQKNFIPKMSIRVMNILKDKNYLINYQMNHDNLNLISKIELNTVPLSSISECSFGVKFYQVNKGKPKQTKEIVANHSYSFDSKINDRCKKVLEGKDVDRYYHEFRGKWIEYGEWLAEPRHPSLFEGERILLRRIVGKGYLIAQVIEGDFCNNSLLHTVKLKSNVFETKYVLGILNSRLLGWYFIQKYARDEKTFPEIRIHELGSLPIKYVSIQNKFIYIVDKILDRKSQSKDTTALEQQIDNLVYRIYELTYDEVLVIDPAFPLSKEEYENIKIE
jgi:hypothetical protein